jgi:hypothetical protein
MAWKGIVRITARHEFTWQSERTLSQTTPAIESISTVSRDYPTAGGGKETARRQAMILAECQCPLALQARYCGAPKAVSGL